jgi:hypothetical protein
MLRLISAPIGTPAQVKTYVGPVLYRQGGYSFDYFSVVTGLKRSYSYRSVEVAIHDRKFMLLDSTVVSCSTADEFIVKVSAETAREKSLVA